MKKALKSNGYYFSFPQFPNHPLNGARYERTGAFTGQLNGLMTRNLITCFEDTEHNQNASWGHLKDVFAITPDMFDCDVVLVELWAGNEVDEKFYLTK